MATYELIASNDLIDNPSPRCACMVILDTSGSMDGDAIRELNSGIGHFIASVQQDEVAAYSVEIAVITAGAKITEILPFTTANNIDGITEFSAYGCTPLGQATELALKRLEQRKKNINVQVLLIISHGWSLLVMVRRQIPTVRQHSKPKPYQSNVNWWSCRLVWTVQI